MTNHAQKDSDDLLGSKDEQSILNSFHRINSFALELSNNNFDYKMDKKKSENHKLPLIAIKTIITKDSNLKTAPEKGVNNNQSEKESKTRQYLRSLFDDDLFKIDETEKLNLTHSRIVQSGDGGKRASIKVEINKSVINEDPHNDSSKMAHQSQAQTKANRYQMLQRDEKNFIYEISNLAISFDGYEGFKISITDHQNDLDASSNLVYFNLEKKIEQSVAANNTKALIKLLMIKILLKLSTKLVGKYFIDLSIEEKKRLEIEANRFFAVDLLDDEEEANYLSVIGENGKIKIKINDKYELFPSDFIKIYFNQLLTKKLDSDFKIINIYVIIPQAFGSLQRKAIKECFLDMCENCLITTRSLIG